MEDKQDRSNEAPGRLRQVGVRPDSAVGARDALLDGKTIEVPNSQTMQLLRMWSEKTGGKYTLSAEVNAVNRGWTVLRRL